jgi:tellurium resistance protein TerZ
MAFGAASRRRLRFELSEVTTMSSEPGNDTAPRLRDESMVTLRRLVFGLRWEYAERSDATGPEVFDLDASCLALDREGHILEIVHPGSQPDAVAGIRHTGDSRTGGGGGDDERMMLHLDALPEHVASLVLLVASMSGCPFGHIPEVACHLTDQETRRTLLTVNLTRLNAHNARVVARLKRSAGRWALEACGE